MPSLAVIIVTWNCRDCACQCLESLRENLPKGTRIIVVDNASEDGTAAMIRDDFPGVVLMEQTENLGFGKANNLAFQSLDTDYVLLLNPDTVLSPGSAQILLEHLERNPRAGLAAPLIVDMEGRPAETVFPFPGLWQYWWHHSLILPMRNRLSRLFPHKRRLQERPRKVGWAMGAALMIRRAAIEDGPLFDEAFFLYSEDADLCRRMSLKGWERHYVPKAVVEHRHRGSSIRSRARTIFHLFHSMDLYYRRHKGRLSRFFLRLSITTDMLLRIVLLCILPSGNHVENIERQKGYSKVLKVMNPFSRNSDGSEH